MPVTGNKQSRANYKGQLTTLKRQLKDEFAVGDVTEDDLVDLMAMKDNLDRIEQKYCVIQELIIAGVLPEEVDQEKAELDNFLAECSETAANILKLINAVKMKTSPHHRPTAGPSSSSDDFMLFMQNMCKHMERQHESMVSLINGQREEIKLLREKPSPVPPESPQNVTTIVHESSRVKLEPLKIPTFSGAYADWKSYQDLFRAVVHNNTTYSDAEKMYHLKTSLTGEALLVIEHLTACEENYKVAWNILEDKYDDKLSIANAHIDTFLNQAPIQKPSASAIRKLQSTSLSSIQALEALKVSGRDPWLINILLKKLDNETQVLWSRQNLRKLATWEDFMKFLQERYKSLETFSNTSEKKSSSHQESKSSRAKCAVANVGNSCRLCNKPGHKLYRCRDFLKLPASSRVDTVHKLKICQNCLSDSHSLNVCSYPSCRHCSQKHNRLLHDALDRLPQNPSQGDQSEQSEPPRPSTSRSPNPPSRFPLALQASCQSSESQSSAQGSGVLLATAIVMILDSENNLQPCRAMLDAGSQVNIMTTNLHQRLKLKYQPANFVIGGVGATNHTAKKQVQVHIQIQSEGEKSLVSLDCLVMPKLTGDQPLVTFDVSQLSIPAHITLADPSWYKKGPIDLLIGGDLFWTLVKGETYELGAGLPILKESSLGWLLVGPYSCLFPQSMPLTHATCGLSTLESIDETLKKFWEVEGVPQEIPQSSEEVEVEDLFKSTTHRSDSGRYVVHLPFKENMSSLQNNRSNAVRQFFSLEGRMKKNPELHTQYNKTIHEYLDLGIVEAVPYDELRNDSYYFPHHCVIKDSAVSTKVRIVFNASSKSQSGLSLNDVLKVGPVVQPSLVATLWRFRLHRAALTCDIVKMYLQTLVHPPHRDYQRFIWRESSDQKLKDLRFRTVCFGVASSPYLATRALVQLADDVGGKFKSAAEVIKNNFYVDDCLVSAQTETDLILIRDELIQILNLAGMELSKFNSNISKLSSVSSSPEVPIDDHTTKTLGMVWSPSSDEFQYRVNVESDVAAVVTQRIMLSTNARIFDPLGLVGPLTTHAKLIIQQTWILKKDDKDFDWDTPITDGHLDDTGIPLRSRWIQFITDLRNIEHLRIPRWISSIQFPTRSELHGFSDASGFAYGAAVYVVTEDSAGNRSAHLMTSKSKISPRKDGKSTLTIPKAELCGAVIALRLTCCVAKSLDISNVYYWVDATVVLHQIYAPHAKREVFVKRRVEEILKSSIAEQWRHVPTQENPADLISRGATASQLIDCSEQWWMGPKWLQKSQEFWPQPFDPSCGRVESDVAVFSLPVASDDIPANDICGYVENRFSRFSKMKFVLAKCLAIFRFWHNQCKRNTRQRTVMPLYPTMEMIRYAEVMLLRWYQMLHLQDCFTAIRNGSLDSSTQFKALRKLRPFVDVEGLLRVGGRIQMSNETEDVKHPIILPKGSLAVKIMTEEHQRLLHAGPQALLSSIRQRFWPINGRNAARRVVRTCVRCIKANPHVENQLMGNLPKHRITYVRAFKAVGVDFAGPLMIRRGVRRDSTEKAYVAVFVCMAVKAVHLEPVSSLSTDAFLACLRRFIARRGIPSQIYSDNGRNFVGASREIKELFESATFQERVQHSCTELSIEWVFLPPKAPHHGGLWEAAVKSFKFHFKRVIGNTTLSFEELSTILAQIEAVMNSRPLTPISQNFEDVDVLTPGMFLIGESLCQLPEPNFSQENVGCLKRWALCQKMIQDFARRWKVDYLHTLQTRNKWSKVHANIQCGDLVLVKDDLSPSVVWPMGRVVESFPGQDGRVRVVRIKTMSGTYKRPISQLVKLPLEDS